MTRLQNHSTAQWGKGENGLKSIQRLKFLLFCFVFFPENHIKPITNNLLNTNLCQSYAGNLPEPSSE